MPEGHSRHRLPTRQFCAHPSHIVTSEVGLSKQNHDGQTNNFEDKLHTVTGTAGRDPVQRERMTGIEPALSAWEADVLPLNYIRARPQQRRSSLAGRCQHLHTDSGTTEAPTKSVEGLTKVDQNVCSDGQVCQTADLTVHTGMHG